MMEKGSFHLTQMQTHVQSPTTEELVRRVPLPNQLPQGLDFSELPASSLKSTALETLIGQNEDLMARLTVALRRGQESEEKIDSLERENTGLKSRFEALKEQFLILQEKDRIGAAHLLELHTDAASYKKHSEKLEKLYSDMFLQAQAFQKRLQKAERHRVRIQKAARNIQKKAKHADQLLQELDHTVVANQQTVTSYEAKLAGVKHEVDSMRAKVQERDQIFEERLKLENELVFERRQREQKEAELQAQIDRFEAENTSLRVQLKESLVSDEGHKQEIIRLTAEVPNLIASKEQLTEQVESLQALWGHKQKELETLEEKNRSLQKLNQSISLTLNQQRKEIHSLEQEMEKERFAADERIKTMLAEIQMLRRQMVGL